MLAYQEKQPCSKVNPVVVVVVVVIVVVVVVESKVAIDDQVVVEQYPLKGLAIDDLFKAPALKDAF